MSDLGQKLAEKLEMEQEAEELRVTAKKILAKKKIRKTVVSIILVLVLVVGSSLGSFLYASGMEKAKAEQKAAEEIADLKSQIQEKDEELQQLIEEPVIVNPVNPKIDLKIIKSNLSGVAELATVEYLFTDTSSFTDSKKIKGKEIPLTEKSFEVQWDGVIKAGVKIDTLVMEVKETERIIVVYLPPAEILSYDVDEESVKVKSEKNNIFYPITVEDKVEFDSKTEQAMKNRAIENGILEKAQKNAEVIIERIITADSAVRGEYKVEFKY